uniref:baseplate J/gp47 family protein n=1 Tax=uncultured Kiloniella sp. TaxID=1133091 RepID=UPI00262981EE
MPYARPTLQEIAARIGADIDSRLQGTASKLRRAFIAVLARAYAGAVHGLYGFISWIAKQVFPDTAEKEYLSRWASIWGVIRQDAIAATGNVTFTGANGAQIPSGTKIQRSDGQVYFTSAIATIDGVNATINVRAETPGKISNSEPGVTLSLVSPVVSIETTVAVAEGGLVNGADQESDISLLKRLLLRIRKPPHGGAKHDYEQWALDKKSHGRDVTRVFISPKEMGPGTVTVRFMMDDSYADGIPQAADVATVAAHIANERPVTSDPFVLSPVPQPLTLTISGLNPGNATVKKAVEAEIKDLIRREAIPGGSLLISHIREAISIAAGETDHALVSPTANV